MEVKVAELQQPSVNNLNSIYHRKLNATFDNPITLTQSPEYMLVVFHFIVVCLMVFIGLGQKYAVLVRGSSRGG